MSVTISPKCAQAAYNLSEDLRSKSEEDRISVFRILRTCVSEEMLTGTVCASFSVKGQEAIRTVLHQPENVREELILMVADYAKLPPELARRSLRRTLTQLKAANNPQRR